MFRNLVIIVALFGLGWGASFGAGVAFGRRSTPAAAQAAPIAGAVQVQGAQGGQGAQGAGQQGGQFTFGQGGQGGQGRGALGTVERLDGQTLTLSGGQGGQQTRVTLNPQTQILKQAPGTTADLTPGTAVTVQAQGQPAADGTITAGTIMIGGPAGAVIGQRPSGQGGQVGQQGGR
ncbi:MAG TPA: hypothetical protein VFG86_21915 [Chloroflexota bacterium]|jgi:hypothetical protein|nr:hypothetical protein [Chloroflexota bacterium]